MQDPDFLARYGEGSGKFFKAEFKKYLTEQPVSYFESLPPRASLFFQQEALKEIKLAIDAVNKVDSGFIVDKTQIGLIKEFSQIGFILDRANFLIAEAKKCIDSEEINPNDQHESLIEGLRDQNSRLINKANEIIELITALAIKKMGEGDGRTMIYELTNNAKIYRNYLLTYFYAEG